MSLKYSCFISYRRNDDAKKYISNLKNILQSETFLVTNKKRAFFDEDSIRYGEIFDSKIYEGIENSYFFMPIWYMNYLHEDSIYCAKELLHAMNIERMLQSLLPEAERANFFYVIPFLVRGNASELPECFSKKLVIDIKPFEYAIYNNKKSLKLIEFTQRLYKDLSDYYQVYNKYISHDEYVRLCESIEKPDDEFVKDWIKLQQKELLQSEAKNIPLLKKTSE